MSFKFNQHEFSIEFNKVGPTLTDSRSVITSTTRHGSTVVFCSVTVGDWAGFSNCLPLSVNYAERSYAINKIPSGFAKREARNRDNEILIARLIDRSIRPTIEESFRFRIQISVVVLNYSPACPIEPLCITAVSATLSAAGVPSSSVVGIKVFYNNGSWNIGSGDNGLTLAGNGYGLSTVETSGSPLHPDILVKGIHFALPNITSLADHIRHTLAKFRKLTYAPVPIETVSTNIDARALVDAHYKNDINLLNKLYNDFIAKWSDLELAKFKWDKLTRSVLRSNMLWSMRRIDGRAMDELRTLNIQANFLPSQGSYLISKGKTRILSIITLSTANESQTFEALDGNESRKFLLQYNYLLSDNDKVGRRHIGHGNLARNALKFNVKQDKFVRVVSEVLDSDGSSSMTTVAAGCLSLKAAGMMNEMVAGVAVGLLMEGYTTKFIVDMTALEDNLSDMDLKVAGTKDGITAIQMDLKIPLLGWATFENGLYFAFDNLQKVILNLNEYEAPNKRHFADKAPEKLPEKLPEKGKVHQESSPKEQKPQERKVEAEAVPVKNKDKVKIALPEELINKINSDNIVENVKKEIPIDIFNKNDTFIFSGKNISAGVNKFLTLLFSIGKEVYYSVVDSNIGLDLSVTLLNGKKCNIKLAEPNPEVQQGSPACVYKGKFGRWSVCAFLK